MLKIPQFIGVFSRDRLPKHSKNIEWAVINLDIENNTRTHWVGYRKIGQQISYYGSFGNLPPPLELQKYFSRYEIKYNYNRHQQYNTTNFGHLCLTFLSCIQ
jgi:hypothetical protein